MSFSVSMCNIEQTTQSLIGGLETVVNVWGNLSTATKQMGIIFMK